jgi:hypothetical protein
MSRLRHPNVIRYIGYAWSPPLMMTEICSLGTLQDLLRKRGSEFDWGGNAHSKKLEWVFGIARGMSYLHGLTPKVSIYIVYLHIYIVYLHIYIVYLHGLTPKVSIYIYSLSPHIYSLCSHIYSLSPRPHAQGQFYHLRRHY